MSRSGAQVRLALHTLGTFDFNDVALLPFVRNVVLLYLSHEDALIRREAALTCSRCGGPRGAVTGVRGSRACSAGFW